MRWGWGEAIEVGRLWNSGGNLWIDMHQKASLFYSVPLNFKTTDG